MKPGVASAPYGVVYRIVNKTSGKAYVGQTVRAVAQRFRAHACSKDTLMGRAMRKHGKDAFSVRVLELCDTREDLDAAEKFWIEWYGTSAPTGYNVAPGGLGPRHSESTKAKQRAAKLGKDLSKAAHDAQREYLRTRVISVSTREKLRAASTGRAHTPEAREKMRAAKAGKPLSAEHRAKLSAARVGLKQSAETRAKRAASMKAYRERKAAA